MASTSGRNDPGGVGITDSKAGSAWAQFVNVWSGGLQNLQNDYYSVGDALMGGAVDYRATDAAAMNGRAEP